LKQFIVNEKGERIGGEFAYVGSPCDIHGRILFWARRQDRFFICDEEGRRTRREYDAVFHLKALADGRAYVIARSIGFYVKETLDIYEDLVRGTGIE
jgi:hypothetical protein